MTKNNIIVLPHQHLRQRSKKVGIITPEIRKLVADMEAATLDWEDSRKHELGVALAAIQVDRMLRIVVVRSDFDNKQNRTFSVLINPEITKYEGELKEDFEGCLSVRDVYGKVRRHDKIRLKARNLDGQPIRLTAEGFLARVLQHEVDHTNGVMFIDHIKGNSEAFFHLTEDGSLKPLDYEKDVKGNAALWT